MRVQGSVITLLEVVTNTTYKQPLYDTITPNLTYRQPHYMLLVMCRLRPEALSRAGLGPKKPGRAGPDRRPGRALGSAYDFEKPEPAAWARALVYKNI